MKIRFTQHAHKDIKAAIQYYNEQQDGLGREFFHEFVSTIEKIHDFPFAWQAFTEQTRRCLMDRFPYGIVYHIEGEKVVILAIGNLYRGPDYWMDRTKNL